MFVILAPGQGSQAPGQLQPWLELPGARERLAWWSRAAGVDLVWAGTQASAEEIRDTAVAQPLLVATGLLAAEYLAPAGTSSGRGPVVRPFPDAVVGHSVGEVTAAVLAGVLEPEAALLFVRARGEAMAAASAVEPTGMSALLGGDPDAVLAGLDQLGLTAANRNGAGQVVAAGRLDALARLAQDPPARARVRPLEVAGAFHTAHMAPAGQVLAALAPGLRPRDPRTAVLSNLDGTVVTSGAELVRRLVEQVAAPVRFDLCLATLAGLGVDAVLELPPAGTLAGLARRELKGVEILTLRTPDDLDAARALLAPVEAPLELAGRGSA